MKRARMHLRFAMPVPGGYNSTARPSPILSPSMEHLTAILATSLKQAGQVVEPQSGSVPFNGVVRSKSFSTTSANKLPPPSSPTTPSSSPPLPPIPPAFDISDPQRAMEAITSLVNMYHGLDRIKEEIHSIASASDLKYGTNNLTEEGNNIAILSQKKSKKNKKNVKVGVPSDGSVDVHDVASDDHNLDTVSQGTSTSGGSDLKNSVREDEDNASLNAFEEDNKKKKKGKASSKSNKKRGS